MTRLFIAACVLACALPASAQPRCSSVFLPDLSLGEGIPVADISRTFYVPPGGIFYPFHVNTWSDGTVQVMQHVGTLAERVWTQVSSVSLVFWYSTIHSPGIRLIGYKTLTFVWSGIEPTWAYRFTQQVTQAETNMALSTPIQLGERWTIGIVGAGWVDLQVEARICR